MTAELLRLRDEVDTSHRLVVDDAPEHYGVRITVAVSDEHRLSTTLDLSRLECLIAELTKVADRRRRDLCPWCDTLGMIDGPDGPEPCNHEPTDVAESAKP
jgi:hypothetical protein